MCDVVIINYQLIIHLTKFCSETRKNRENDIFLVTFRKGLRNE